MATKKEANDLNTHTINIKSKSHEQFLDAIDELRSQGISRYIDLPQIIVCGDQSSGKSSVLEAVSGLKFPTADIVCTRYATELILRRNSEESSVITIVPDANRTEAEKTRLKAFKPKDNAKLGEIVGAASEEMGLDGTTQNFSSDVLRIEISGPNQPHLTLVDLPGLFHSGSKTQTENDVVAVKSLVTSYMAKTRSVILAVVSAKNDINNQIVVSLAKQYDPRGTRTLGIITKPDTLPKTSDSERQFFELAQNKDVKFTHGWHVIKNRDYEQRNWSNAERDASEKEFFSKGLWSSLSPSQRGIDSLRTRLSKILQIQILNELPNLISDVEAGIRDCRSRIDNLGASRGTLQEQRIHLHNISDTFTGIIKEAVDGKCARQYFNDIDTEIGYQKRIHAVVVNKLDKFAEDVRCFGHTYETVDQGPYDNEFSPIRVSRTRRLELVKDLVQKTRGKELATIVKEETVTELFRQQCFPWIQLAEEAAEDIFRSTKSAVVMALDATCDSTTRDGIMRYIVSPVLLHIKVDFDAAVQTSLRPHLHSHPTTYNHYLTENLQKARSDQEKNKLAGKLEAYFGINPQTSTSQYSRTFTVSNLFNHLIEQESEADMMNFACSEALQIMNAYYKVAMKQFVDDFSVHAVEEALLQKLEAIFPAVKIFSLDDATIQEIAGETEETQLERAQVANKLAVLQKALDMLKMLDRGVQKTVAQA